MKLQTLLILILAGALIFSLFWNVGEREVSEAYRLEKEQVQRHIKKQIDSVNRVIIRKDAELLKAMRESAEADMMAAEAVKEAEKYKTKYDKIVFRATRTDRERDSLIRAVLHH